MIPTQKLLYFIISLMVLVCLAIGQYFILGAIVEIFTSSWSTKILAIILSIVLINPVLTKMIMELLPFEAKNLKKQKIKKTSAHNIKA